MLKIKMDNQLSTSRILDDSPLVSMTNRIFDIYCGLPSYLKKLHLSFQPGAPSAAGLYDNLSLCARTLKALDISVSIFDCYGLVPLAGPCEGLEAMAV